MFNCNDHWLYITSQRCEKTNITLIWEFLFASELKVCDTDFFEKKTKLYSNLTIKFTNESFFYTILGLKCFSK